MNYWLMKSEPNDYSIDDLKAEGKTGWDGIRNYQARNLMRDQMQVGDWVLFYHSNAKPPGVVGLAQVSDTGLVDHTQFETDSKYYDAKSSPENPRWTMVEVEYRETFPQFIPLPGMRETSELEGMMVLKKGARLSIQPVSEVHFKHICQMGQSQQSF